MPNGTEDMGSPHAIASDADRRARKLEDDIVALTIRVKMLEEQVTYLMNFHRR